jgi:crotonobetainyl-CoA:carnitine CoA-transferase CaiB-like acyl-CoA transferase
VAVGNDAQWRRLCAAIGATALGDDERLATNPGRIAHREEVVEGLAAIFPTLPADEWLARLQAAGVPCGPLQGVHEALTDPVLSERGGTWPMRGATYGEVETVPSPFRLQRTPASLRYPAPGLGEHSEEIRRRGWDGAG